MNSTTQIQNPPNAGPYLSKENLFLALKTLSGASSSNAIKESETALLSWENSNPSLYVDLLIEIVHESILASGSNNTPSIQVNQSCYSIALLSLLSIKAAVKRHWKPILSKRKVMIPFSEDIKWKLRSFLLILVCPTHMNNSMPNLPSNLCVDYSQFLLWRNRTFQNNVSSLLSKIARMDLPLQFFQLLPILCTASTKPVGHLSSLPTSVILLPNLIASQAVNEVLFELSSKRLLGDRKYFMSVAQEQIPKFSYSQNNNNAHDGSTNVYFELFNLICRSSSSNKFDESIIELALILTRILHKLLLVSFPNVDEETLESIMSFLCEVTSQLLNIVVDSSLANEKSNIAGVYPLLDLLLEMPSQLQKQHPISFANCKNRSASTGGHQETLLTSYLKAFFSVLISVKNRNTHEDRRCKPLPNFIIMHALQFISNVVSCTKYNNDDASIHHQLIWNQFLTETTLVELIELILHHLMPLSSQTSVMPILANNYNNEISLLEYWHRDPESYILMELGEGTSAFQGTSEFNENKEGNYSNDGESHQDVRFTSQNLYLALLESNSSAGLSRKIIGNHIAKLLGDFQSQLNACCVEASAQDKNGNDIVLVLDRMVLIWDAIFTAAGVAVNSLAEFIDWDVWWLSSLGPALGQIVQSQGENTYLPILRCRIIWLIGCHAHLIKPEVYLSIIENLVQYILSISHPKNDAAVKFTTVQTLTSLLYEPPQGDVYLPYSIPATLGTSTISSLYQFFQKDNFMEVESRRSALTLISLFLTQIISPTSQHTPDSNNIIMELLRATISPLYSIWKLCTENEQTLLHKDLFSIISCTISTIGRLIPDPQQWVKELYSIVIPMIDASLDPSFREENMHLEEDALLAWLALIRMSTQYDEQFHHLYGRVSSLIDRDLEHLRVLSLITEYYIFLGDATFLNVHAKNLILFFDSTICNVRPRGALCVALVLEALLRKFPLEGGSLLIHGGIAVKMLESCMWNFVENDEKREVDSVIVLHLTVFARMLLADVYCLDGCFPLKKGIENTFNHERLLGLFFRLFDSAGYGPSGQLRRKLWSIFFVSLLPPSQSKFSSCILNEFDQVVNVCVDVLTENSDGITNTLSPHEISYDSEDETIEVESKYYRKILQDHNNKDIAFVTDFSQYVREKLNTCSNALGSVQYQNLVSSVEPVILSQLQKLVE